MMKYLQKLGKSLMLPVACLPVAAILMGIGYWIDPTGWGANNIAAAFLIKAGSALVDNMAILFAIGVGVGMSEDNDGTAGLAGLVSWLMITTLLSTDAVAMFKGIDVELVPAAFSKIQTQFIGIIAGLIGAGCYNKFKNTKLPPALGFFSGKRCVAIVTAAMSLVATIILLFVWPVVYGGLVSFGELIVSTGAVGAGIYGFSNRILIPFGLHHALNSVFWFDVAGINDIAKFWGTAEGGILGQTGMYMAGFFPVMMFGLPAAALAMYHTAFTKNKKVAKGVIITVCLTAFLGNITEPLEFTLLLVSPILFFTYAILAGVMTIPMSFLGIKMGYIRGTIFDFGIFGLLYENTNWINLVLLGLVNFVVFYFVFKFMIKKFNFVTPGREDFELNEDASHLLKEKRYKEIAEIVIEGLGGKDNLVSIDNCVTRLRLEVKDYEKINEKTIKSSGISGIIRPGKTSIQIIVGTQVQFVADELKKLCK